MSSEVEGEFGVFIAAASDFKKTITPPPPPKSSEVCNLQLASPLTKQPRPQHHVQLILNSSFRKDICGTSSPTCGCFLSKPELRTEAHTGVVSKPVFLFGVRSFRVDVGVEKWC